MARYIWTRARDTDGSLATESAEWSENWTVRGVPAVDGSAWQELLRDRPDLRPGQPHPTVAGTAVSSFDYDRLGTTRHAYTVTVGYRGEISEREDPNPLNRSPRITLAAEEQEVAVYTDAQGRPMLNTAGDLIAGLTEFENRLTFNVRQNVTFLPRLVLGYANAVNSDAVRILGLSFRPGYLLFRRPRLGDVQYHELPRGRIAYREFSYELHFNPNDWSQKPLNRGLNAFYKVESDKSSPVVAPKPGSPTPEAEYEKRRIQDAQGNPVDTPQFLDWDGKLAGSFGEEDGIYRVSPAEIITLNKWTKKQLPFRLLGLR